MKVFCQCKACMVLNVTTNEILYLNHTHSIASFFLQGMHSYMELTRKHWLVHRRPCLVSPASLLDSQHGSIASPHESGQLRRRFGLALSAIVVALSAIVVALSAKMNKTTPHNNQIHFLVQEIPGPVETKPPTELDQTPSSRAVMQYIRAVNQGGWLARLDLVQLL